MSATEAVPRHRARCACPRSLPWAVTIVTGIGLWLVPSFSSYWLDETVTVWVIQDDLGTTIDRALGYQQSPFYFVIAWFVRQVLGTSEFALRVPSLVAAILATWFLYRLALRLHDGEAARLVAFAFVASPWMALAAARRPRLRDRDRRDHRGGPGPGAVARRGEVVGRRLVRVRMRHRDLVALRVRRHGGRVLRLRGVPDRPIRRLCDVGTAHRRRDRDGTADRTAGRTARVIGGPCGRARRSPATCRSKGC